jgi:hypothetical protein
MLEEIYRRGEPSLRAGVGAGLAPPDEGSGGSDQSGVEAVPLPERNNRWHVGVALLRRRHHGRTDILRLNAAMTAAANNHATRSGGDVANSALIRRFAALTILSLMIAGAALFAAAKCYPPNTRVVVFIQGVYSTYDASGTAPDGIEAHTFDTLKQAFIAKKYDPAKLLDFSYAGGGVSSDGVWHPAPYGCEITDRQSDANLAPLEQMLKDYRAQHQKAHFTLVGHSLGGYLAFLEGAREAQRPDAQQLGISEVVTLDAPIGGVNADKKLVLDISTPCTKTYLAGGELVGVREDPTTPATRAAQGAAMAKDGIRLATLGSADDCLYNLPSCAGFGTDDTDSQFVPSAALSRSYEIHVDPFVSHFAILTDAAAVADAVQFVGAP